MFRLIYTKGAIEDHRAGKTTNRLLAHRISNIDGPTALAAFVAQLRTGTPYLVFTNGVDLDGEQVAA